MDSILTRKSDHSIAVEFFHDILDEHFSEDEVKQQLETALHWGRYAEIFDYDSNTGRSFFPKLLPRVQSFPRRLSSVKRIEKAPLFAGCGPGFAFRQTRLQFPMCLCLLQAWRSSTASWQ